MQDSAPFEVTQLESIKTNFDLDFLEREEHFRKKVEHSSIVILGAAGSIGSSVVPLILKYSPRKLLLIDQDENRLTTLLRYIRAKSLVNTATEVQIMAADFASNYTLNAINEFAAQPTILNFAAAKHVRSERDQFGILHLLTENFLKPWKLIERTKPEFYFAVSTDKAANPVNFMGASKALHEQIITLQESASTTRFANVAFSQGSLLESWSHRIRWREPLVVPSDIERYLISHQDAAKLCAIAMTVDSEFKILVPSPNSVESKYLKDIAVEYLHTLGIRPEFYADYLEARSSLESNKIGTWPIVVTDSETHGEKKRETFIGELESSFKFTPNTEIVVPHVSSLEDLLNIQEFVSSQTTSLSAGIEIELLHLIKRVIPNFNPLRGLGSLDTRP